MPLLIQSRDASAQGNGVGSDSQVRTANFPVGGASATQASDSSESQDPTSQTIRQLERQLQQVLQQIQRLQASRIPDEQKAPQLQALNAEAATLQSQIANLIAQQAQAAQGGITA